MRPERRFETERWQEWAGKIPELTQNCPGWNRGFHPIGMAIAAPKQPQDGKI